MKDISLLIARRLLGLTKKDGTAAISRWQESSQANRTFLDVLETFWRLPVKDEGTDRAVSARQRLLARLTAEVPSKKKLFVYYLSRIAASVVLILSVAGLSVYVASKTELLSGNQWVEVSTETGQKSKVALPDGTLVWLNAETVLKYHPDPKERKVSLTGEAYFEVSHDEDHPFIVEADHLSVQVLGTKFNVSHYAGSEITEASLISGKISLLAETGQPLALEPGEKAIYNAATDKLTKTTESNVQNEILWRQGILVFRNEIFMEMIRKLERYYGVTFVYDAQSFENIHYTGTINNLTINRVLDFINLTIPINYEIDNKTIKLSLRK